MNVTLCTVTPVYRGEKYLRALVEELDRLRLGWESQQAPVQMLESIFVDDGSVDDSATLLAQLSEQYPWVTVVTLSRNVGQHSATAAGICHSSADWVVTLDEDLQHRPVEIERLLAKAVETGADVCYAKPSNPVHGGTWRDRASVWTKSALAKLTDSPQIKAFNSFRLIRGSIARAAAASSSSQTYLDIAISWFSNAYASVPIDMEDQRYTQGKSSGYGLAGLIRHARHLLVSSSLDIASKGLAVGVGAVGFAVLVGLFVIIQKLIFPESIDTVGWASLVAITSFFGGIIIALLCIALEYLHVLVLNQLGKPTFFTVDRSSDRVLVRWLAASAATAHPEATGSA
jgi:glycosyltransferase involved in cell wall biosynthesis